MSYVLTAIGGIVLGGAAVAGFFWWLARRASQGW